MQPRYAFAVKLSVDHARELSGSIGELCAGYQGILERPNLPTLTRTVLGGLVEGSLKLEEDLHRVLGIGLDPDARNVTLVLDVSRGQAGGILYLTALLEELADEELDGRRSGPLVKRRAAARSLLKVMRKAIGEEEAENLEGDTQSAMSASADVLRRQ